PTRRSSNCSSTSHSGTGRSVDGMTGRDTLNTLLDGRVGPRRPERQPMGEVGSEIRLRTDLAWSSASSVAERELVTCLQGSSLLLRNSFGRRVGAACGGDHATRTGAWQGARGACGDFAGGVYEIELRRAATILRC